MIMGQSRGSLVLNVEFPEHDISITWAPAASVGSWASLQTHEKAALGWD